MAGEIVRFSWGVMMNSCFISIMRNGKYGETLHISGENGGSASKILAGLSALNHDTDYPIQDILPFLPKKGTITWEDKLYVYMETAELRGKASNFKSFMTCKVPDKPTEADQAAAKAKLEAAIQTFNV